MQSELVVANRDGQIYSILVVTSKRLICDIQFSHLIYETTIMFDLEEEHDDCQQCLLTIVARGTAIITEIYRLVELIPEPFQGHKQPVINKQAVSHLNDIICDFSYFKNAEEFEAKIESDPELKRADEQFCDDHIDTLTRFYLTFEAIQRQANDINRFIIDLEDGVFIGQSLDGIMANHEGRQLLCEAHFQIGYMLLLVDRSLDGDLRERMIVSYYRYSAYRSSPGTNLDETCNLMRSTGYKCHQQKFFGGERDTKRDPNQAVRPVAYPESFFARVGIDQSVVSTLIAKLQTVDIYNQTIAIFPHPDHRSNALAQQASILYVLLYFCPNILKTQRSRMREITDKFFSDNWVVHIFMGEFVNLIGAWEPYRAARESLLQIHEIESVKSLTSQFNVRFNRNAKQLEEYLKEGWLSEDSFIEHSGRILNCIRDSNVTLKWLLLHSRMRPTWHANKPIKTLSSIVVSNQPDARKLCEFLQNLCLLEKRVSSLYDKVLQLRKAKVGEHKSRACDMLDELVCIFNDTKPMRWVKVGANQGLAKILAEAQAQLNDLDLETVSSSSSSRDVIVRLVNRIEVARESYSDGKSLQVVQLFMDTKENLVKLLRFLDLAEDLKTVLQSVGDFGYGWTLMDEVFTEPMQQIIKDNPKNMFALEAVIIKLTSAFESQLVRIQQVEAQTDLISVSQYYSSKLVAYIRKVLQIIPATILELISSIITIQANNKLTGGSVPSRIHLDQLRDYAMPEQRLQMLQLTCKISHYARGIMAMPDTPIGLMRIDSKRMLEDGLRRELYKSMFNCIQDTLSFEMPAKSQSNLIQLSDNLLGRLGRLDSILNSYKRSFEYVQDFLSIYGLKMWQEELSRIVRASVDQSMANLLNGVPSRVDLNQLDGFDYLETKSVRSGTTTAKARSIISTNLQPQSISVTSNNNSTTTDPSFMVRVLNEIIKITNPRETIYDEQASAWFDKRHQQQVLDATRVFRSIGSSLSVSGLNGLDRLCSALLMSELEQLKGVLVDRRQHQQHSGSNLLKLFDILDQVRSHKWSPMGMADGESLKHLMLGIFFAALNQRSSSSASLATITASNRRLIDQLLSVGQLQLIRLNIQCVLSTKCRYEARHLHGCLETLNSTLLATIRHGKRPPNQQKANLSVASNVNQLDDEEKLEDEDQTNRRSLGASLDESQLVFELATYLEWIGLSDPMSKIYTLALQRSRLGVEGGGSPSSPTNLQPLQRAADGSRDSTNSSIGASDHLNAIYHTILEHSTRLQYSLSSSSGASLSSTNDRTRRSAKNYTIDSYPSMIDGQPLYLGIVTLLNHFQTDLMMV